MISISLEYSNGEVCALEKYPTADANELKLLNYD